MTDTLTTLSAEAKSFYDRKMLDRALPVLAMYKAGQQRDIPSNSGNQVSYRRVNTLTTATTALTEGTTPVGASLSVTEVTGTVAQYGNYVQVSDALNLMGIDPIIRESSTLLGENAGQSLEEVIRTELVTGTSVSYATGSARASQAAANVITTALVRKAVRTLEANDAKPFYGSRSDENGQGGFFLGFIHPNTWYDLIADTTVLNTVTYSDPDKLYTLKFPELLGVAWIKTTKAPVFSAAGSGGVDVYGTIIVGMDAFGVVNVGGTGRFNTIVKPLGSAGSADPLEQRATIGWKSFQLPKILNNNFMTRIEHGVTA